MLEYRIKKKYSYTNLLRNYEIKIVRIFEITVIEEWVESIS
jgi:hypothetical protein